MIIIIADVDEVAALLGVTVQRDPEIVRPQTSGPCVHYDERSEHAADAYPCTYPYDDGRCPHLDNPEILCPVKDACYAMQEVARMRDACEAEQEEQDADMAAQDEVYETETPEFVEPTPEEEPVYEASPLVDEVRLDPRGWTPEEEGAMREATTPTEAVALYRAAYPGSSRTDAAIKTRYNLKIRPQRGATPAPEDPQAQADDAGKSEPEIPVTVPEEETPSEVKPPAAITRMREWTAEEDAAIRGATTPSEAVALYRSAIPDSGRSDGAIRVRWHNKIRPQRGATPAPDFAGDAVPVTQYEEPRSTGAPPYPRTGARVQIRYPPEFADRTGTVVQYNPDSPEMLVALDNSLDRIWLPPESLVLVGAGRGSP